MTRSQRSEYCAAFGAVIRELRQSQGRSRSWLAQETGIPACRLSQLERGETRPDDGIVVKLAQALNTTPTMLWSRACERFERRVQLDGLLEDLGIPHEYREEFYGLDAIARDGLVAALDGRIPSAFQRQSRIQAIEAAIERDGVAPTVPLMLGGISSLGLSPAGYYRAAVEFEEMPGSRSVLTDRLPISPVEVPMDRLFLYRANYGVEPPNPMLLKWWAQCRRSALDVALSEHDSRTIIPIDRLLRYIRSGERARNVVLPPELVKLHLIAMVDLLRARPHFRLGLADGHLPLVYKIKADHHVLVTIFERLDAGPAQHAGTTLLFSRSTVVRRFNEHFDRVWDEIPEERRDNGAVAVWLEEQLGQVGDCGSR